MLCESSPLSKTERGFIVEVAFSGRCGEGSPGNSDANEMAANKNAQVGGYGKRDTKMRGAVILRFLRPF